MTTILSLVFLVLLTVVIALSIKYGSLHLEWKTHVYISKSKDNTQLIVYNDFINKFNSITWVHDKTYDRLFNHENDSEVFLDVFKFNGIIYTCKNMFEYSKISNYVKYCIKYNSCNFILNNDEIVEKRLLESLQNIAKCLNIPISYHEDLGDAAGKLVYHADLVTREPIIGSFKIKILERYKNSCVYLLAHELGHYFAIMNGIQHSEEAADEQAYNLCCSILTKPEYLVIYKSLAIHFNTKDKEAILNEAKIR